MTFGELLIGAATLLSGGGIGAIIVKLIDRRPGEMQRLRTNGEDCERRCKAIQAELTEMSARLRAVESSTPSYLSRWIRGQDKRLLWLNDRAFMSLFAPLGWARDDVLDKTFKDLLGEGSMDALNRLDQIDRAALRHPGEVQSLMIQLHPDLPMMMIVKVAFAAEDGQLRYEGSSFVPSNFAEDIGRQRQLQARTAAAEALFNGKDAE